MTCLLIMQATTHPETFPLVGKLHLEGACIINILADSRCRWCLYVGHLCSKVICLPYLSSKFKTLNKYNLVIELSLFCSHGSWIDHDSEWFLLDSLVHQKTFVLLCKFCFWLQKKNWICPIWKWDPYSHSLALIIIYMKRWKHNIMCRASTQNLEIVRWVNDVSHSKGSPASFPSLKANLPLCSFCPETVFRNFNLKCFKNLYEIQFASFLHDKSA